MAIGNEEFVQECFHKHSHMGTKNEIRQSNRRTRLEDRRECGKK